ncbi:MAG: hypothetical protein JWQ94_3318, partial [Tardiphaga sp.]|nr:hypothetical protein [Tardiphaga sp.]
MTKIRLLLLATTTLSVAQFAAPASFALQSEAAFVVAQAAPPTPEGEPKAPPKAVPKGPPPGAAPPRPAAPPA